MYLSHYVLWIAVWPALSETPWCQVHNQHYHFLQQDKKLTTALLHHAAMLDCGDGILSVVSLTFSKPAYMSKLFWFTFISPQDCLPKFWHPHKGSFTQAGAQTHKRRNRALHHVQEVCRWNLHPSLSRTISFSTDGIFSQAEYSAAFDWRR